MGTSHEAKVLNLCYDISSLTRKVIMKDSAAYNELKALIENEVGYCDNQELVLDFIVENRDVLASTLTRLNEYMKKHSTERADLDALKVGDNVEWDDGIVHLGMITDILDENEVYVEYFHGHNMRETEVSIWSITVINGVRV